MDMVSTFSALRSDSSILAEKLKKQMDQTNQGGFEKDERFWKPKRGKDGNGYAVIRFLPPPKGEESFYVRMFDHGFKGPTGSWYIEKSLTTIGEDDPVGKFNTQLWNSGDDKLKEQAKNQKRRTQFYSNVLVIDDTDNPANNGKVFLYSYGKKIFEMINDKMNPKFKDETSINVFDFWNGADFKLKITTNDGDFPNYDKSTFSEPSALFDGDMAKLEELWNKQYSLVAFLEPSNFKSYDELDKKFKKVMGMDGGSSAAPTQRRPAEDAGDDNNHESEQPPVERSSAPLQASSAQETKQAAPSTAPVGDEDPMEYFKKFAS